MPLPVSVNVVRVRGYLFNEDGTGATTQPVTFAPANLLTQYVINVPGHGFIKLTPIRVLPDSTGYFYADLVATNDPDVTSFAWAVAFGAGLSMTVVVPINAPVIDVGGGLMMQAIWLTEAATMTAPPTGPYYYTSAQTDAAIAAAIAAI